MSLFTKEVFFEKRRKKEKKEERLWNIEKLLHKYKPIKLNVTLLCNELNLKRFQSLILTFPSKNLIINECNGTIVHFGKVSKMIFP